MKMKMKKKTEWKFLNYDSLRWIRERNVDDDCAREYQTNASCKYLVFKTEPLVVCRMKTTFNKYTYI